MRTFRRETGLYFLVVLIGLAIRLINLGALPLSDLEAGSALHALDVAHGTRTALGSQPSYVVLTSLLFFAFGGASNVLARLIPALTGSALVLVPALFKERLKPRPAVLLAFALALEPGLTALSRQAGSAIMIVTFALAAWGLWEKRLFQWAGVCAGMALLSGPALWPGLLGIAITWALLRPIERAAQPPAKSDTGIVRRGVPESWITAGSYAVGTIILIGTMFMTVPAGLSAWIGGLPDYISGWVRASDVPIGVVLSSLIAYQPVGVLLALMASVRGWLQRSLRVRRLSLWMIVALLLAVFYPSRQVVDLVWMLIPLWALASLELARNLNVRPHERREVLGAVALSCVLLLFIWLDFLVVRRPGMLPDQAALRMWLLLGSFFLLVVSLLLIGMGWSSRVARYGAVWGLGAVLSVYSFGALMAAAGHRSAPNSAEMWSPGARLPMAGLLLSTVQEQSAWSDLDLNSQPVAIVGIDSPALEWLLRDRPLEQPLAAVAASNAPIVITADVQDAALASAYRGQSLVWRSKPNWRLFSLFDWLPFHEVIQDNENVILWVRNDLFADARPRTTP